MAWPHARDEYFDAPIEDARERPSSWFVYVAWFVVRPVIWLMTRYSVRGRENIPARGQAPVVFAANHVSFMDPCVLWCMVKPRIMRLLARDTLYRPLIGGLLARVGALPVAPETADRKAVKRAAAALKRGECVGIFPEGTRMNRPDKEYRPHAGLVLIAQMGKAKIVPVGISGTERMRPHGTKLLRFPKVYVNIGECVDPADFSELPKSERTQAVLDATMRRIFELRDSAVDEAVGRRDGDRGR